MNTFTSITVLVLAVYSVSGQNCGITGVTNNTIYVQAVSETTAEGEIIWTAPTYNVTGATAVANPFNKYITGLRYSAKYEYVASEIFSTFVQTERDLEIVRNVIFTCDDTQQITYSLIIPVEDENTEPPVFKESSYNATLSFSNITTEPTNIGIIVRDSDVHLKNANLYIRSSNPYISLFVSALWNGDDGIPESYEYRTDFFVNKDYISIGTYQIILTADDGKHSAFTYLNLTITP